jgi:hypothetical protein
MLITSQIDTKPEQWEESVQSSHCIHAAARLEPRSRGRRAGPWVPRWAPLSEWWRSAGARRHGLPPTRGPTVACPPPTIPNKPGPPPRPPHPAPPRFRAQPSCGRGREGSCDGARQGPLRRCEGSQSVPRPPTPPPPFPSDRVRRDAAPAAAFINHQRLAAGGQREPAGRVNDHTAWGGRGCGGPRRGIQLSALAQASLGPRVNCKGNCLCPGRCESLT